MKRGHEFEFRRIPANLLRTDTLYQRDISQSRVNKIVQEWNPDLMNEPKVSQRDGGAYYVFNGNHTVNAHKIVYGENTPILCKVYRGLTWLDEKELFVKQNGISKDPTTAEKLLAEYNGGNVEVKEMVYAANDAGLKIDFKNSEANNQIRAVSALFKAYKMLGRNNLTDALELIVDCWNGDKSSLSAGIILGVAEFCKIYGGKFNRREFVKKISEHSTSYYVREVRELNGMTGHRYFRIFLREYNKGKKTNKLDVGYSMEAFA